MLDPKAGETGRLLRYGAYAEPTVHIFLLTIRNPRLNITYGVGTRHFVGIACVPNLSLSHYRKMVLNVVRVSDWAAETPLKIESRFVATSESTILKPNLLL